MYAQLAAYRRTLQRTLESSRTMDQVVASKALPWLDTPDQAVVWAYALGLHEEAEEVLERSMEDVRTGAASPTRTYFPLWFGIGARDGGRIGGVSSRAPLLTALERDHPNDLEVEFGEAEREALHAEMNALYGTFVDRVATGRGLATDADGNLYVADEFARVVRIFEMSA